MPKPTEPTPAQLEQLRADVASGKTYRQMALAMGVCVDTLKRILHRHEIVMFDGGAQPPGVDWGGRDGLDAKCQAAAGPLGLNKAVIHAFISTGTNDVLTPGDMANYVETFSVPTNPTVVSPLGIKIATSASELTNWQLSLICAGVVHEDVSAWVTGVKDGGNYDATLNCAGWTLRKEDLNVRASVGLTDTTNTLFHDHLLADHWVSCSNATAHVLCLGWDAP